jgi:LuxR family transcriptional regulator, regulator of acetate metabolism
MAIRVAKRTGGRPWPTSISAADVNLMRRADAAGQRLFRELVVTRIAWATVSEASRLIAVDVVGFSLRTAGCAHPPPCDLHHCFDRLEMKAVLGNRTAGLPSLRLGLGAGVGGRVLAEGRPCWVGDYADEAFDDHLLAVARDEEIGGLLGIPVSLGGEVRGVLHVGRRRRAEFSPATIEALSRLCTYSGGALAAAYDRARVEEIAALRERRRLTRALHDELGQILFAVGVSARMARESAATGRADQISHLIRLERQVTEASSSLRRTLRGLDSPPTPVGSLSLTLREDVAAFNRRTAVPAHLIVLGDLLQADPDRDALLVDVAREALRNVERHASAEEVVVTLHVEDRLVGIVVQDDGTGYRPGTPEGLGLAALRREVERRGGSLRVARHEDMGTVLRATLPVGP